MPCDHLHKELFLDRGDVVVLDCDTQVNFMLMESRDYANYRVGRSHRYYGGFCQRFPARVAVPHYGRWNVVVDVAGGRAGIQHSLSVIKRPVT